jgi:hypothetical protein
MSEDISFHIYFFKKTKQNNLIFYLRLSRKRHYRNIKNISIIFTKFEGKAPSTYCQYFCSKVPILILDINVNQIRLFKPTVIEFARLNATTKTVVRTDENVDETRRKHSSKRRPQRPHYRNPTLCEVLCFVIGENFISPS